LLDDGDEVAQQEVENQRTGQADHNKQHEQRHKFDHLAGNHRVELGLVGLFAFGGVFHDLLERTLLSVAAGHELAGHDVLGGCGNESKDENGDGANIGKTCGNRKVYLVEQLGLKLVFGGA